MFSKRLKFKDYEAWIQVEGQEVEHHQVNIDEGQKLVTCWIASTEGKKFTVHGGKNHSSFGVVFKTILDGNAAGGYVISAATTKSATLDGIFITKQAIRPFVFGTLKVSDDDSLLDNAEAAKSIGEIRVEFYTIAGTITTPNMNAFKMAPPKSREVHEKAKKATPHRVQYGEETPVIERHKYARCDLHEKLAEFVFRYTSLEMLKATGITPSGSSTESSPPGVAQDPLLKTTKRKAIKTEDESENDPDDEEKDSEEEEAELKARLARLQKKREVKHRNKRVKQELKPVGIPGEVIDLTL